MYFDPPYHQIISFLEVDVFEKNNIKKIEEKKILKFWLTNHLPVLHHWFLKLNLSVVNWKKWWGTLSQLPRPSTFYLKARITCLPLINQYTKTMIFSKAKKLQIPCLHVYMTSHLIQQLYKPLPFKVGI